MNPLDVHRKLNEDLDFFAEHGPLVVKDKAGELVPWVLNKAQRYMQECAEKQLAEKGYVRMLLLKGRQQGGSTWVNGRFYHKTTRQRGRSTFILSHEGKTTDKLFTMVRRFHENVKAALRPALGKDNPREITLPSLGADYAAGTAGNEHVGRGGTAQLFHGSEAAYWEKAYEIQDGALKSIGLVPGTEIILESTANGPLGLFYDKCMQALKGVGDYILCFVPWFWDDGYERPYDGSELTEEEEVYIDTYLKDLPRPKALRKIIWRRAEIVDLSTGDNNESGRAKFRTIYPSNVVEAFQSTGVGLFRSDAVIAARKSGITDPEAPKVAGVDPAGDGDNADRTVISIRQGRQIIKRFKYGRMRPMELAGILAKLIDTEGLDMVFIDRGYGEGTIDRLHEMGYGRRVIGIAFNERTLYPDLYLNKRSEIIIEYSKWLNAGDVAIPDDDETHAALACIPLDEETSNGLKFLKSKREIKKSIGGALLLDIVDADALTFAYPVKRALQETSWRKADGGASVKRAGGPLSSMARRRARGTS